MSFHHSRWPCVVTIPLTLFGFNRRSSSTIDRHRMDNPDIWLESSSFGFVTHYFSHPCDHWWYVLSTILVIVIMSWWCYDDRKSSSSLRTSSWKKVALLHFQKSCFEDCSQAAYILSCENPKFPQTALSLGVNFSHCAQYQGANIFLQRKMDEFSILLEGNLLEGWVGIRMVVQKLAFQIYWDHSYPSN